MYYIKSLLPMAWLCLVVLLHVRGGTTAAGGDAVQPLRQRASGGVSPAAEAWPRRIMLARLLSIIALLDHELC